MATDIEKQAQVMVHPEPVLGHGRVTLYQLLCPTCGYDHVEELNLQPIARVEGERSTYYQCQGCSTVSRMVTVQHKGATYLGWAL